MVTSVPPPTGPLDGVTPVTATPVVYMKFRLSDVTTDCEPSPSGVVTVTGTVSPGVFGGLVGFVAVT